ncbi:MAG: hypothetical protein HC772_08515 [Leptolyngbyaceae cyanobacterium CRU_2_3]|nr:hypothetical protein [Leptolyngbyaceae cyanobacterium CRU_2_3]
MSTLLAACVDGVESEANAIAERWLGYGDGLFESIAICAGHMPLLDLHWQRLTLGCARLKLPMPDTALLQREAQQLARRFPNSALKIIVGASGEARGYARMPELRLRRALLVYPKPEAPAALAVQGLRVRLCETTLAVQPALAGIKHLNRLEQVLARSEWSDPEIHEGLMTNAAGEIICATSANVFCASTGSGEPRRLIAAAWRA